MKTSTETQGQLFDDLPVNRRRFLQVAALGSAGFIIGCSDSSAPVTKTAVAIQSDLNAFVRIGTDNIVTVIVKHLDKGQGVTTGLPAIVAEELDADWSQMRAEFAPADASRYNNFNFGTIQGTGGSSSVANSWTQLRDAAAGARDMLVRAAASTWGVDANELTVDKGEIQHASSERSASFGSLAATAATLQPPEAVTLKDPAKFTLIGTTLPRIDSPAKTDGSAKFTIDHVMPGMLVAVVAHPPRFGARVESFDASAASAVSGVTDVVEIPRGVAVVADSFFSATKARAQLEIEWDFSDAENRGSDELAEQYRTTLDEPGIVVREAGNTGKVIAGAETTVESDFSFPFLAHAPMEPMDCVVDLQDDRCDIWTGSQIPTIDQAVAANISGLLPEQIHITTLFAGGSFGRRAVPDSDFVAEAVMIAKALGRRAPIKLQWSREDDMSGGRYRPMALHRMRAGLDKDGHLVGWEHRIVTQSIFHGTPFAASIIDGVEPSAVEGARGLPYAVPNIRVEQHLVPAGVPVLWWRSVGHSHNGFATEVMLDKVAAAAGADPYEFRRGLLRDHPRHLSVLDLAAKKAGWGEALPAGTGRGIAVHESFGTVVAEVAEVTVHADGGFKVDRVTCAVDCGIAITPDVVRAQMEGGIGYGLSAALREAVTLVEGEVQQRNFDAYRPLRIHEMPRIDVHIVPSTENPTGVGEPGTPPIAPAVANAIGAASGRFPTTLPFGLQSASA